MLERIYYDARHRVAELAANLDESHLRKRVPATPEWTVHQLLAHLVGGAADAAHGRVDGAGGDEWTARHVTEREGEPVHSLLAEWRNVGPAVEASLVGQHFRGPGLAPDLICHEADLHEALTLPRVDRAHWHDPFLQVMMRLLALRLEPLTRVVIRDDCGCQWSYGAAEPTAELRADGYELLRAMFSRRSRRQIAAWNWTPGPAQPVVDSFGFFGPRDDDQPVPPPRSSER